MPYTVEKPPEAIEGLPKHLIEIWVAAFNAAFKQYDGDEPKSAATAWAAVKAKFKKEGDKWVAKEADPGELSGDMESLQAKYSEIVQEVGKRNATLDSTRIKKIVELCQELLSSELPDEKEVKKAIKEADKALVWLGEQSLVKTEDNVKYPAEAFAYVPDNEQPSTWRLRIWESVDKKVTKPQLARVTASLSPGGFRGLKATVPAVDLPGVKRKIRSEYRSLGIADTDIPRWVKEVETRERILTYTPLTEAKFDKGRATVIVIKPGFNYSQDKYYPAEMLKRDYGIFEGMKMYANHPTKEEEDTRPERRPPQRPRRCSTQDPTASCS